MTLADRTSSFTDLDRQIENLLERRLLIPENEVKELCDQAKTILSAEPNVQYISAPVTVVGDVHGQFYDLKELFRVGGWIPDVNYLFLGDYVDRGMHSVETILLLLALKVRYPNRVSLLRGNHETRGTSQVYGFYDECMQKYQSSNVWRWCCDVFDHLGLAAVVDDKVFCVHGGLSPHLEKIDQMKSISRGVDVPQEGPMSDMMWSDPSEETVEWATSPRGAGLLFGKQPTAKFCEDNGIEFICRAHQLVMEGYKWHFEKQCVTVWSAPNYCYRSGNVAAIMCLPGNLEPMFSVFHEAPQELREPIPRSRFPEYFL